MEHVASTNLLTEAQMAHVRARLKSLRAQGETQIAIASKFAISQSLVSRILDEQHPHTITRGYAENMAGAAGMPLDELIHGSAGAGRWAAEDAIVNRGRAMDVLSAVYDDDFLRAVRGSPPPPGADEWTMEQWVEQIVTLRRSWAAGLLGSRQSKKR